MSVFQILALAWLVGSLLCFGWAARSFFVKHQGSTAGVKLILIAYAICAMLQIAATVRARDITPIRIAAASVVYFAALLLFWWAIRANRNRRLSAAFSPDLPEHLIQAGPYRYVRHPFYSSYLLAWSAGVIASGQLWVWITVAVMVAIYVGATVHEERKFLSSSLAEAYTAYRGRTGRLMVNPWKWLKTKGGASSSSSPFDTGNKT